MPRPFPETLNSSATGNSVASTGVEAEEERPHSAGRQSKARPNSSGRSSIPSNKCAPKGLPLLCLRMPAPIRGFQELASAKEARGAEARPHREVCDGDGEWWRVRLGAAGGCRRGCREGAPRRGLDLGWACWAAFQHIPARASTALASRGAAPRC